MRYKGATRDPKELRRIADRVRSELIARRRGVPELPSEVVTETGETERRGILEEKPPSIAEPSRAPLGKRDLEVKPTEETQVRVFRR